MLQQRQVGTARLRGKQPFGHHQDAVDCVHRADAVKQFPHVVAIEMLVQQDPTGGAGRAMTQPVVGLGIDHDMVRLAHERRDGRESSGPARREERHVLQTHERAQRFFERLRGTGMRCRDDRTGAVRTGSAARAPHCLMHTRMGGQRQIVRRREIDAVRFLAAMTGYCGHRVKRWAEGNGFVVHGASGTGRQSKKAGMFVADRVMPAW
jgi:hypothetical protein